MRIPLDFHDVPVTSGRRRTVAFSLPALVVAAASLAPAALGAADEVFTPKHVARLKTAIWAAMSPDGGRIAYRVAVPPDIEKGDNGSSYIELHVLDASGVSRPFISGKVRIGGVAWTPDGRGLSFLDKRGDDKKNALWVLPIDGGEAARVLSHETGVSSYSWSPDGEHVAFLSTPSVDKKTKGLQGKGFNQIVYEEDWRAPQIWIGRPNSDEKSRLIELEGSPSGLRWSPAGDRLLVELSPTPLVDDHYMHRRLHVIDVESGKVVAGLGNPGKLGQTAWSPDGRHVAYITGIDESDPKDGRLWVSPAGGGKPRDLLPDLMGHVSAIAWSRPDRVVYVADVGCLTMVGEVTLDGKNETLVPARDTIYTGLSLAKNGNAAALVGDAATHPSEVFRWQRGKRPQRVTHTNPWLEKMRFAKQEVVRHAARDGLELEGILVRPLDAKKGERYPLILAVHGGPESHVRNGWVTRYAYPGQVGAARGFAVFYPNYRGSTGRGVEFSKISQADAAGKEFDDLVDAVDHFVGTGLVDKKRVGITGGSYGGYASAWGATYYSHRFAASVMFVGISDNVSKVGTTDIPVEMYKVHHRKWLWDDWKYFLERSPIYHIKKARTPILILHGKEDPRVHPSQSLELHRHLKILGQAPVRLVLYPGEGHGNRKAAARYDYNLRMMRWFEHYLQGDGGAPPPHPVDYGIEAEPKEDDAAGKKKERIAARTRL